MQHITSLAELISLYDGFIIDLWGVVHDGAALYPGVKASFQALRAQQKRVVMLSNAPRRAAQSMRHLEFFGIQPGSYDGLVTSGEVSFEYINTHYAGACCYVIGPEAEMNWGGNGILKGMDITRVREIPEAEFVLVIGHYYDHQPLAELLPELEAIRQKQLPMLCANPDREVITMDGTVFACAGEIADAYQAMGGEVTYIGKPYPLVYEKAKQMLGLKNSGKILAIGDNLLTDIKGANNQGIDSLLVASGVLSARTLIHETLDKNVMERFIEEAGEKPTYYMRGFGMF